MIKRTQQKGFTLIELLVVIAIIGILSSVVLASLNNSREKADMAKLKSDFNNVRTALELYHDDNGEYPQGLYQTINWSSFQNILSEYIDLPSNITNISGTDEIFYLSDPGAIIKCGSLSNPINEYTFFFRSDNTSVQNSFDQMCIGGGANICYVDWFCATLPTTG